MQNSIQRLHTSLQSKTIGEIIGSKSEEMIDSHMALISASSGLTIEKSLQSPKVFQLKKQLEEADLMKVVVFVIKNFCDSLNVKDNMNALQVVEAANEFVEKYTHESLEDFILCLKKGKNGEYGPIYNKIDRSVLFSFWAKYLEEKSLFLENKNLNYKGLESHTVLLGGAKIPEKYREEFSKIRENIQKIRSTPKEAKPKTSTNSLETFMAELKEWLPSSKPEERDNMKKDARNKNATYVLNAIEEFEKTIV